MDNMTLQQRQMVFLLESLRPWIEQLGGGKHEGEDLFGDVQLACVQNADRYDWWHPKIGGLVVRIARNLRVTRLRRERLRRHARLPAEDCPALACEDSTGIERPLPDLAQWQEVMDSLPDRYRHIIEEHFARGKRLITIARQMSLPPATVRTRCRRALQRLAGHPAIQQFGPDALWDRPAIVTLPKEMR